MVLKDGEIVPNAIHNAILDLKPCHIITTNYDDLIEQAYKERFELNQLKITHSFERERDLLRRIVACVERYDNELPVLGDFVLGVLPEDVRKHFKREAYSLRIDSEYLELSLGKLRRSLIFGTS